MKATNIESHESPSSDSRTDTSKHTSITYLTDAFHVMLKRLKFGS